MALIRNRNEVSRLEAFSDAVFGFSATLLVVSLQVPATFDELILELKGFGAFGISFGALVLIWSVHNAFFRRYGLQDTATVILNSILLFVVLFYVYPLKFVVEGLFATLFGYGEGQFGIRNIDDLATLFMLYSIGFVAIFLCVSLLYHHASRLPGGLQLDATALRECRFLYRHYLIFVAVGLFSILLAWLRVGINWGLPGFIYSLLGPLCYVHAVKTHPDRGK